MTTPTTAEELVLDVLKERAMHLTDLRLKTKLTDPKLRAAVDELQKAGKVEVHRGADIKWRHARSAQVVSLPGQDLSPPKGMGGWGGRFRRQ
ncbi:MAG: hypothetical protein HOW73_00845 [Polyangiaceae bacterium]|nr:hypothetical protein [Polyangiaceae bacterium]